MPTSDILEDNLGRNNDDGIICFLTAFSELSFLLIGINRRCDLFSSDAETKTFSAAIGSESGGLH
jgi:hypothetical protein